MECGRFAAVFMMSVEHRPRVDVIVLQRDELAVLHSAESQALLGARTMADRLKHHLPADDGFHRPAQLPRRPRPRAGQMCPRVTVPPNPEPTNLVMMLHVFLWQAEHFRQHACLQIADSLRRFIQR